MKQKVNMAWNKVVTVKMVSNDQIWGLLIQSEVSQKDKDHYNILTHIYGIKKDVNDNSICRTEKETQIYSTVI